MTGARVNILLLSVTLISIGTNVFAQLEPENRVEKDTVCMNRMERCNRNLQVLVQFHDLLWNTSVVLGMEENILKNKEAELEFETDNLRKQLKHGVPIVNYGRPVICSWPGNKDRVEFLESIGSCSTMYKTCISRLATQKKIVRDRKKFVNNLQLNIKKTKENIQKIEEEIAELQERLKLKILKEKNKLKEYSPWSSVQILDPITTETPPQSEEFNTVSR